MLLDFGADASIRGNYNRTAIKWAAGCGHTHVVRAMETFQCERDELAARSWRTSMSGQSRLRAAGKALIFNKRLSQDFESQ